MKKLSKYECECRDNENLLHSIIFVQNYKYGYLEKLIPLSFSDTFTDRDFIATIYSIAMSHGIDITRMDVFDMREEVRQFAVNADN